MQSQLDVYGKNILMVVDISRGHYLVPLEISLVSQSRILSAL